MEITEENIWEEASKGNPEVLKHPQVDKLTRKLPLKLKFKKGSLYLDESTFNTEFTPLHLLTNNYNIPKKWIKEKYPWYKLKKGYIRIDIDIITDILRTQNAAKFIESL